MSHHEWHPELSDANFYSLANNAHARTLKTTPPGNDNESMTQLDRGHRSTLQQ